jgi:hypothetical protein
VLLIVGINNTPYNRYQIYNNNRYKQSRIIIGIRSIIIIGINNTPYNRYQIYNNNRYKQYTL